MEKLLENDSREKDRQLPYQCIILKVRRGDIVIIVQMLMTNRMENYIRGIFYYGKIGK